jgi:2-methylcitrate dehydratase PrpD
MGKPYNAGIAAANGVEAAKLAGLGFVSCDDGVFGAQGFVETHSDVHDQDGPWTGMPPKAFVFEDVKYKLHACCHGTHAMIDAMRSVLEVHPVEPENVAGVTLRVNPRWLQVCEKKAPRTGLEVKFSYAWLAGMVVSDIDTSAEVTFTDALCTDPKLAEFAKRVFVSGAPEVPDTAAIGTIEMMDGRKIKFSHDLAACTENSKIETGLRTKASNLIGVSAANSLWSTISDLDNISAQQLAKFLC